ncbi:hypothetical protein BA768_01225 [Chryseobacterium sp. CBo1]|uniref:hypothetical protein n=1 Tax=Chryseobacterium sp. CBo1 TaxID=1869230 RepID=UPI000810ECC3|nr:hypothetical protein [Chryseobacterium sp. CBo1]OCK53206.1 hypothetical protein BA768_01225 [Chryseobacterium sp. CBo1]
MYTSDEQILKLPRILKDQGVIPHIQDFHEHTGITKQLFSSVKNQQKRGRGFHFTAAHIETISKVYGIDINWIFALSDNLFRNGKNAGNINGNIMGVTSN